MVNNKTGLKSHKRSRLIHVIAIVMLDFFLRGLWEKDAVQHLLAFLFGSHSPCVRSWWKAMLFLKLQQPEDLNAASTHISASKIWV